MENRHWTMKNRHWTMEGGGGSTVKQQEYIAFQEKEKYLQLNFA